MAKGKAADSLMARGVLEESLREFWGMALPQRPDLVTVLGGRVISLPGLSHGEAKQVMQGSRRVARIADRVNVDALAPDDYVTLMAIRWEGEIQAEAAAFYWSDFSSISPAQTPVRQVLLALRDHPLTGRADAERFVSLLGAFPPMLDSIKPGLEARRTRGYVASREAVESAIGFFRALRALGEEAPWHLAAGRLTLLVRPAPAAPATPDSAAPPPADSVARQAARADSARTDSARTDSARADSARAALLSRVDSIGRRVELALDSVVSFLDREYLAAGTPRSGLWQYPGGKEYYRYLLRRHSSLDVAPEQAHRIGLASLARVDSLMAGVRERVKGKGTLKAFHDSLRGDARAATYTPEEMLEKVLNAQQRMLPKLAARFARLPAQSAIIRPASRLERLLFPDGTYTSSAGGDLSGEVAFTPRWLTPASMASMSVRSFTWFAPGRDVQRSLMLANPRLGAFRRLYENEGFIDGWTEYAAGLAGESGMYAEPADAYARLLDEGFHAALLVVDTGVHYLGWTRAQAMAVLRPYSLESDAALDTVYVERIVGAPGRAGAATLGAREIAAMREWAERELGSSFDVRRWHDELLSLGALPLPIVGTHFEWWIWDQRRHTDEAAKAARAAKDAKGPKKP